MIALDTNVLLYAHDPRDERKQRIAVELIQSITEGVLMWQVVCEYLAASAKLEPYGYNRDQAWQDIEDLRTVWANVSPLWTSFGRARDLMSAYSLSFWDALLLGGCIESGVATVYSEDFDAYSDIAGLAVINPFRATAP